MNDESKSERTEEDKKKRHKRTKYGRKVDQRIASKTERNKGKVTVLWDVTPYGFVIHYFD
jgi:hypothetical protein